MTAAGLGGREEAGGHDDEGLDAAPLRLLCPGDASIWASAISTGADSYFWGGEIPPGQWEALEFQDPGITPM